MKSRREKSRAGRSAADQRIDAILLVIISGQFAIIAALLVK
jgi:hypothetical protein